MKGLHRSAVVILVLMMGPAAVLSAAPRCESASEAAPRVRPLDDRVANALAEGLRRSPTLWSLVDQLTASDVVVYLQTEHTLPNGLAGRLTWLNAAAGVRYLRVWVSPSLPSHGLIATIGHELQHALEVAGAPSVVDSKTLSNLYRQIGHKRRWQSEQWETTMAQDVGQRVRLELREPITVVAESIQSDGLSVTCWYSVAGIRSQQSQHVRGVLRVRPTPVQPDA